MNVRCVVEAGVATSQQRANPNHPESTHKLAKSCRNVYYGLWFFLFLQPPTKPLFQARTRFDLDSPSTQLICERYCRFTYPQWCRNVLQTLPQWRRHFWPLFRIEM